MARENIMAALDIGTTKVCCLIAEIQEDNTVEIIGFGESPSHGMKRGVVIDVERTVSSIKTAVEEAEMMSGTNIDAVYVGIAGSHIQSMNSHGVIAVKNNVVSDADKERVVDAARAVSIPADREVIHAIPQEYIVDHQDGIKEPNGMKATRLEVNVHIVSSAVSSAQNIVNCVQKSSLQVIDIVMEQIASAEAVLTEDEKELGVAIVDVGGGTTDIAVYHTGYIKHTSVITIGGFQFTSDLQHALRTSYNEADTIKKEYGCALFEMATENEFEVHTVGSGETKKANQKTLATVLEPRADELFSLIQNDLEQSDSDNCLTGGIVLTGGSILLEGIDKLAERVFSRPVRIGKPIGVTGLKDMVNSPKYSTAVGLLKYGLKSRKSGKTYNFTGRKSFDAVYSRFKEIWKDYF
ncbi:MAG: cell division protein FtsA [Nitrospinae bacterium]|nr:cell division protein FtsA [Nitrospinota bacterium]